MVAFSPPTSDRPDIPDPVTQPNVHSVLTRSDGKDKDVVREEPIRMGHGLEDLSPDVREKYVAAQEGRYIRAPEPPRVVNNYVEVAQPDFMAQGYKQAIETELGQISRPDLIRRIQKVAETLATGFRAKHRMFGEEVPV